MEFKMEDSLGFIINKTALKMKNNLARHLKPYEITPEQWGILNWLWEKEGISQKELSEKSFKDQPNVTRILDKLEEKGLIKRQENPDDRRAFSVFLTEKGYGLKGVLVTAATKALDEALQGFDTGEIQQLKNLLEKIFTNLTDREEEHEG
ncbi:transcriptional regulator, MarR family [Thermincola ferriacetica]|uniref:Transcriptional regulator, MarR family n=1 Tax=Thermincola ferriacetica TaxID=281456 RepID=A0A0L6W0J1_9FIRM|nr:MarR family transcriptional regulator [Thermincola ferriacetica]KNZ69102.1 transcriptional regulator, MarR family [Thermincola ferriacetica]